MTKSVSEILWKGQYAIPILSSGPGWIAVDKPSGFTVHNDRGNDLQSIILDHISTRQSLHAHIGYDASFGVHAVHRLDRMTSGVILFATSQPAFRYFSEQFTTRQVDKIYMAILHGHLLKKDQKDDGNKWKWPLSETPGGRDRPQGAGKKIESKTAINIIDYSKHYSLVECRPLTGRTHQIRRHAKLAGHPVIGDRRYGTSRSCNYLQKNLGFNRLGLHALSLCLTLPDVPHTKVTIATDGLPNEMRMLFNNDITK